MAGPSPKYGQIVRGGIQNLSTTDWLQFPLNPREFQTAITVNYAAQSTLGGSHQWLQYTGTANAKFSLTLSFSRYVFLSQMIGANQNVSEAERNRLQWQFEDAKRFLMELCYPRGRASDPIQRSPATALILWPANVGIVAVLRSLTIKDERFDEKSRVTRFTCETQWEEYRQYRLTANEVRRKGLKQARAISEKELAS